jgi:LysR family transcriptional repressor of citA
MNTESLKTFIILAQCNSFTKTAQKLMMAQPTISNRIKELEAEIGQVLFVREKNSVSLTEAGKIFLGDAVKILELENAAITKANMSMACSENLTLGCTHTLFDCYVLEGAIRFAKNNPHIPMKLDIAHSHEILTELGNSNLDLAYTYYPFRHGRYICRPFIKEPLVLVTNGRNRVYEGGISKNELMRIPIVFSDITDANNFTWLPSSQKRHLLQVNIISKIVPFLKNGDWYCFLPRNLVKKDVEEGNLIEIPLLKMPDLKKQSYVIYRRYHKKSSALARWIELNLPSCKSSVENWERVDGTLCSKIPPRDSNEGSARH